MSGRIIGYLGIRRIPVVIAREITVRGTVVARRLVDTIDAKVVDAMFRKVEHAYHGNILFTEEQKKQLTEVRITSMPHESDLDLENHLSFVADKEEEPDFVKGHVTTNPAQQKPVV